jgi:hypothetical protein
MDPVADRPAPQPCDVVALMPAGIFGRMSSGLSRAAGSCPVVVAAVRLSEGVGEDGVSVTPGGSLRPADVTAAAAGLVTVVDDRAVRAGRLDDPLAVWWAGLRGLLDVEAADRLGVDPRIVTLATIDVVTRERVDDGWGLQHRVEHIMYDRGDWALRVNPQRHGRVHPAEAALALLRLFGAVEGTRLTSLGTWVREELRRVVPPSITPALPAGELLSLLAVADEADAWNWVRRWFGDRTRDQIVAELVQAAGEASSAERITAVMLISGLGDEAVAALRATEPLPDNLAAELVRHGVTAARYLAADALGCRDRPGRRRDRPACRQRAPAGDGGRRVPRRRGRDGRAGPPTQGRPVRAVLAPGDHRVVRLGR